MRILILLQLVALAGKELQGSGSGYMGGGYGDANGNSGYGNASWKFDPSQASGNYGAQTNGPHGGQFGYGGDTLRWSVHVKRSV